MPQTLKTPQIENKTNKNKTIKGVWFEATSNFLNVIISTKLNFKLLFYNGLFAVESEEIEAADLAHHCLYYLKNSSHNQ